MSSATASILSEGKTKILEPGQTPDTLKVTFKDQATAFNAQKVAQIAGKGAINARVSLLLFQLLERFDLKTCLLGPGQKPEELLYQRLSMIPVEVVVRNAALGSLVKRLGLTEGQRFERPLIEFFWKDDAKGDPNLTEEAVYLLNLLPEGVTLNALKRLALAVNEILLPYFESLGILCADYKLEFGLNPQGELILGDELSPDGFRLRDLKTGQILDKDVFRLDLGDLSETYQALLGRLEASDINGFALKTPRQYVAQVFVASRKNILSPESKTTLQALHSMGYNTDAKRVETLRAGRRFQLTLWAPTLIEAEKQLKAMAENILSNPVIEDFGYEIFPSASLSAQALL